MNCINCFHYNACAGVDVTGYVADIEHEDYPCEHYITPEEVHPVAWAVERVEDYITPACDDVFVRLHCSNCDCLIAIKSYKREDWDKYFKDHHSLRYDKKCCPGCGAVIIQEETNAS